MFKYDDGSDVLLGDNVLIENGKTPGVVELIITTEEEAKNINVDEVGIMLKSPPFGLVYFSKHWLEQDPLRFVSRAKA
ncbi:MAG: hypothetical protein Q7V02_03085 [Methylophilus sp.]|nr:hypothetical protein [Methylophilus sp.]